MKPRKLTDLFLNRPLFTCMPNQSGAAAQQSACLPDGFVYIDEVIPDILLDLRYCTTRNFIGERIDGYLQARGILTLEAAQALGQVQAALQAFGLALKIFDAYRPQQAVDHFDRWVGDQSDTRMKAEFYPQVDKQDLIREGYIARRSSHTRGSTVDLTIVSLPLQAADTGLDMGSRFDYFGPESWPDYMAITPQQRANRMLLRELMMKHGFVPYPMEWWHFTLEHEPFPDSWFDFPVQ
jgi:D-alanyl-D-alanine dipeptidase